MQSLAEGRQAVFATSRILGVLFVWMFMSVEPVRSQDDNIVIPTNPPPAEVSCCCISPPNGTMIACISPAKELPWEQPMDSGLTCSDYKPCEK